MSRFMRVRLLRAMQLAALSVVLPAVVPFTASAQLTIELRDYVTMPATGKVDATENNDVLLARVNGLREEPGGANRLFVPDLNGPLYILAKDTKKLATYLDFNGRDNRPGLFHRLFF